MKFLGESVKNGEFTAAQYAVFRDNRLLTASFGTFDSESASGIDDSTQFDLASLTKALFTAPLFYRMISEKIISAEDDCGILLGRPEAGITVYELLAHKSGFVNWLPFYEICGRDLTPGEKKRAVIETVFTSKRHNKSYCYSDLNYILLGFIAERLLGSPFDKIFEKFKAEESLCGALTFRPERETPKTAFSELRKVNPTREVEDENCFYLGGATGHAGLFGSAQEVAGYLAGLIGKPWFTEVGEPLDFPGFDRPEGEDSIYGRHAEPEFLAHLGFTGTAFLLDRSRKTVAVLLTNSTYPTPDRPQRREKLRIIRQTFFESVF
ncbi:beta-lactamase family protein [bacterium]|nr:beta-lactamase family protein [bacterium]